MSFATVIHAPGAHPSAWKSALPTRPWWCNGVTDLGGSLFSEQKLKQRMAQGRITKQFVRSRGKDAVSLSDGFPRKQNSLWSRLQRGCLFRLPSRCQRRRRFAQWYRFLLFSQYKFQKAASVFCSNDFCSNKKLSVHLENENRCNMLRRISNRI